MRRECQAPGLSNRAIVVGIGTLEGVYFTQFWVFKLVLGP